MSVDSKRKWILSLPLRLQQQAAAPATPAEASEIYTKASDKQVYSKDADGVEARLSNNVICTSLTRPASPVDGMQIYETDTFNTLIYYSAKGDWFPPWNTAWGSLREHVLTTNSSAYSATGTSDMVLTSVPVRNDRKYKATFTGMIKINTTGTWVIEFNAGGTNVGRFGFEASPNITLGDYKTGTCLWLPAATAAVTLRVGHSEIAGTSTLTYEGSGGYPRMFWLEDIGPR